MSDRVIQTEFDSRYFDIFGELMVKSCLANNPGWRLHVLDFGLRPEQRELLERIGTVEPAKREIGNRWATIRARIEAVSRLLDAGKTVVHIDGDVFVPGSVEGMIVEMDNGACDAAYIRTWMQVKQHIRHADKFKAVVPLPADASLTDSTLAGVTFCVRPSDGVKQVYSYLVEKWDELRGLLYTEESAMWCSHVLHAVPYVFVASTYGHPADVLNPTHKNYILPSDAPQFPESTTDIHVIHFANEVWRYTNVASPGRAMLCAWQHAARRYLDMAWDALVAPTA